MCRMYAEIHIFDRSYFFHRLWQLSKYHPDGWGIVYKYDKKIICKHSTLSAYKDENFEKYFFNIPPTIALVHLRKKTSGTVKLENTQPFVKNSWIFMHNGCIEDYNKLLRFINISKLCGNTDSEIYFHLFRKHLKKHTVYEAVKKTIDLIKTNCKYSSLNFIASEGHKLYILCEYTKMKKYYTLWSKAQNNSFIVFSEKFAEDSIQIKNHSFVVVDRHLKISKLSFS